MLLLALLLAVLPLRADDEITLQEPEQAVQVVRQWLNMPDTPVRYFVSLIGASELMGPCRPKAAVEEAFWQLGAADAYAVIHSEEDASFIWAVDGMSIPVEASACTGTTGGKYPSCVQTGWT